METSYRAILSSGTTVDVSATAIEALKLLIADPLLRWEPYLLDEDGPFVIPAHVAAIEIVHAPRGSLRAAAETVATMDPAELSVPEKAGLPAA